jgi:MFS family permease
MYGRRWSMLPAVFVLGLFSIGTATSTNTTSIFLTRFFAGAFGSAPVTIGPAALADIFSPQTRGIATAFFVTCVIGGPLLAPIIGSALTVNPHLGWQCEMVLRRVNMKGLTLSQGQSTWRQLCPILFLRSHSFACQRHTTRYC